MIDRSYLILAAKAVALSGMCSALTSTVLVLGLPCMGRAWGACHRLPIELEDLADAGSFAIFVALICAMVLMFLGLPLTWAMGAPTGFWWWFFYRRVLIRRASVQN